MLRPLVRLALFAALLGVTACGDGAKSPPPADLASVLFRVHVPPTTPAGDRVYVAGDFNGWNQASPQHALARTAALTHEITLAFARGSRIEFQFTRGSAATVERGAHGEARPNRTYDVAVDSVLDLTVESWADRPPTTATGDVTRTSVPGFLSGRHVWIYLPPGYHAASARYPVLYLLDGQNVFDAVTSFAGEWRVDEALEALIPAGQVTPLVVVAVANGGAARIDEYTPWADPGYGGGAGRAHLDAIADVLVPWVNANYRTQTGPAHTAFGGSSLGGLMTLYALYARPDAFGLGMAMSPSIWWDGRHVVAFAAASKKPAARAWSDMGTAECGTCIDDLRAMRDAMVGQGFVLGTDLTAVEVAGAVHNEAAWSARFPDAVKFLFPTP